MPRPRKIRIPEEDYAGKEPDYLPKDTTVYWHVDGSEWQVFRTGYREGGWFTSPFDEYFVEEKDFPNAPSS